MLLLLKADKCPYCGEVNSDCAVELEDISSVKTDKISEKEFLDEFVFGESPRRIAFLFSKNICYKGKKK